jgi:hypothetical protein
MLGLALLASAMADPDRGPSSGGTVVLVAAAIVALAGLCLFLLFRRGSIADRARTDVPDPGGKPAPDASPDPTPDASPDPSSDDLDDLSP